MNSALKKVAGTLYSGCRPTEKHPPPLPEGQFRFFSHGRHALCAALGLAGVGTDDIVLLPEYICRDTLSAINVLGAKTRYYPVSEALTLSIAQESLPQAKAIVAVNYFGFPQDLSPFEDYCERTGAILIEDNAHGFLSRDEEGRLLGTRGDIGIFSFRKSIPLINGSGMLVSHPEKFGEIPPQLPFADYAASNLFELKKILRRLAGCHMTWLLYRLINLDRKIRALRTGSEFVESGEESEHALPGPPGPDSRLLPALASLDVTCETARRRALFSGIGRAVERIGGMPVFPDLPSHVVPYGFPFTASPETIPLVRKKLKASYIDFHPWPELPSEIAAGEREFYKSVQLVNFFW